MIHRLSDNAQFITTTFRAELLINVMEFSSVIKSVIVMSSLIKERARDFIETKTADK